MRDYFRLMGIYLRIGVMNEVQYRVNFWVQLFRSLWAIAGGVIVLLLVFDYTESLGGWSYAELLVVLGVHTLMYGVIQTLIQPNMQKLMEEIRDGLLDYTLVKPEDAQLLVSVRELRFWQLVDILVGMVVIGWGISDLQHSITLLESLAFVALLLLGGLMIYSLWLAISTTAFWFISVNDIMEIFNSLYQAGRWPTSIYPGWLRLGLTFLVPVAFAITVPAEALTGRLTLNTLAGAVGFTLFLLALTRWFWLRGVASYAGASA